MKRALFAAITGSILLVLAGCGGGGDNNPPPTFVAQILSRAANDGDIELDSRDVYTVTQGNLPSVFAGVDPVTDSEFRAFLDFPLTGADGVPGDAIIDSASLDLFITSLTILPAASSIPIRIELVSFPPQTLLASDFDATLQPTLAATTVIPPIARSDAGRHVIIDVTGLMVEAQRRGLSHFQVRILEDFGLVFPGLIEIDDATINRAPLLTVTYF